MTASLEQLQDQEAELRDEQLALERKMVAVGKEQYDKRREDGGDLYTTPGMRLMRDSIEQVAAAIRSGVEEPLRRPGSRKIAQLALVDRREDGSHAWLIEPEAAAFLTLRCALQGIGEQVKATPIAINLGSVVQEHIEWEAFEEEEPEPARQLSRRLKSTTEHHARAVIRERVQRLDWTKKTVTKVGFWLLSIASDAGSFFDITDVVEDGKTWKVVKLTEHAQQWLADEHARCALLDPAYLPMVVKPKPWTSPRDGGYLSRRVKLVKRAGADHLEELQAAEMSAVYRAVNVMQETPWRMNKRVLEVMREAWKRGLAIGKLPPREDQHLPPKSNHKENGKRQTKRIRIQTQLRLAEKFRDFDAIYFPHVLDFRGRAYPIPSHLTPQADDPGRALLEFAKGEPHGEDGAFWLQVHLANLYGFEKGTFEKRSDWTISSEAEILSSAMDPLNEAEFWSKAKKPWQFLAACFEYHDCLSNDQDFLVLYDKDYVSHLPIAMDGTCNGLQHFSAMLRDPGGAEATNLEAGVGPDYYDDLEDDPVIGPLLAEMEDPLGVYLPPEDIYQRVVDKVKERLERDAEGGNGSVRRLIGHVDRELLKGPVMTVPYGVTRRGMQRQIHEVLVERRGMENCWAECSYLASVVGVVIDEDVAASKQAHDWFKEVARVVTEDAGQSLRWTSPIGFPVLQAYYVTKAEKVEVTVGGRRVRLTLRKDTDKLDKKGHTRGIAPNFVHSCDAAHMMATVHRMADAGITSVAMVHDSYATLAGNVNAMNALLRVTFVEQYRRNILEEFREEIVSQLPPNVSDKVPPVPALGKFQIEDVLHSEFFFS